MDQILSRLVGYGWYYFVDDYSRCNQIVISPKDKYKTTFTFPYRTSAFKHILFGQANMVEDTMEFSWMTSPSVVTYLNLSLNTWVNA